MLKFVDKVLVGFAPLSKQSISTRTFLNRIRTSKNIAENPKVQFEINVKDDLKTPYVHVLFKDKKLFKFEAGGMLADEMILDLERYSKRLQLQEDIKNAS